MIVDRISLALGALLVTDMLGYEERWIKTLDLKIVTGFEHQYKLIYGILVYADGDVILIVTCDFVFCFHYVPFSAVKNSLNRVRIYCISVTFSG